MDRVPVESSRLNVRLAFWSTITSPGAKNLTQCPLVSTYAGSFGPALAGRTTEPEQLLNATIPVKSTVAAEAGAAPATIPMVALISVIEHRPRSRLTIAVFLPVTPRAPGAAIRL